MTFEENLRRRINDAAFGSVERNVLKVVLGDVQQVGGKGRITDETCYSLVKKLIKGNDESLGLMAADDSRRAQYVEENRVLNTLLPAYLGLDEIRSRLVSDGLTEGVRSAKSEGQAVGVAMGHLKKLALPVDGETVKEAVRLIRA